MPGRERFDERAPQLGLAHAGERRFRQSIERAAASALLLDAEKALPAAGVDAVPVRSRKPASRADPIGVPVPRMVGDGGNASLRIALGANMLLDIRELLGTEAVQQTEDVGVEVVVDHASGDMG